MCFIHSRGWASTRLTAYPPLAPRGEPRYVALQRQRVICQRPGFLVHRIFRSVIVGLTANDQRMLGRCHP